MHYAHALCTHLHTLADFVFTPFFCQVYLKCYEEIATNFMIKHKIPYSNKSRFFINSKGKALSGHWLDFSDFAEINGLPRATSHIARKMFVDYILAQRSSLLKEAEQYTLCHRENTAEESYLGKLRKKALAVMGSSWYHTAVGLPVDRLGSSKSVYASKEQAERMRAGQIEETEETLQDMMMMAKRKDEAVKYKPDKVITNVERVALVEALI